MAVRESKASDRISTAAVLPMQLMRFYASGIAMMPRRWWRAAANSVIAKGARFSGPAEGIDHFDRSAVAVSRIVPLPRGTVWQRGDLRGG